MLNKNIIVGMVVGIGVGVAGVAGASWSNLLTMGNSTIKPTVKYDLETAGWDARLYEFTPAYNKDLSCIFVATEGGNGGLTCYERGQPNQ